jgi:hypothetical protein
VEWFQRYGFVQGDATDDWDYDEPGYHMTRQPNT